ncbi:MAG: DUF1361 domain-containing protein [Ilumatobacteraceae bacterium]
MKAAAMRVWSKSTVQLRLVVFALAAMSTLVFALALAQKVTGGAPPLFILFNLFLAWIPLLLALVLADQHPHGRMSWWLVLGTWLLFLPNSPYVLTDVLHLRWVQDAPSWRFTIQILTLAVTGLLLGMISLQLVHSELRRRWGRAKAWWAVGGAIGLASFGVSIGRFGRWNSWDTITRPKLLMSDIVERLLLPQRHPVGSFTALAMAVLLLFIYVFMYALAGGPLALTDSPKSASLTHQNPELQPVADER